MVLLLPAPVTGFVLWLYCDLGLLLPSAGPAHSTQRDPWCRSSQGCDSGTTREVPVLGGKGSNHLGLHCKQILCLDSMQKTFPDRVVCRLCLLNCSWDNFSGMQSLHWWRSHWDRIWAGKLQIIIILILAKGSRAGLMPSFQFFLAV